MRHLATIARVVFGLIFLVFAANYFVPFLPPQPPPPAAALAFVGALVGSGLLALIKALELAAAVALLANRFVPLALAVLAPAGVLIAVVVLALELALTWQYRAAFASMLRAKVEPAPAEGAAPVPSLATR